MRLGWVLCVTGGLLWGQNQFDPNDALASARDKLIQRNKRIPNYTCVETIERTYFKRTKLEYPPPACDQIIGEKKRGAKLESVLTDRLRLDVKVSDGLEIGSWVGASRFESGSIVDLVKEGPIGTGPFGTFIQEIFSGGGTRFEYVGREDLNGKSMLVYRFEVPKESSHYNVKADDDWVVTGFSGSFYIDPESADLKRLNVETSELPPETHACESRTSVDYERVRIGTGDFLLASRSEMHEIGSDTNEAYNVSTYSGCHEYHGEATIRFGDMQTLAQGVQGASRMGPASPEGLSVALALAAPIDTDTAAAGDVVMAMVRRPVREKRSQAVLIPAGARVRGRIIAMQHWLGPAPYFSISIRFQTLEMNGVSSPFYAKLDRGEQLAIDRKRWGLNSRGATIWLPPPGEPPTTGTLVFQTKSKHYIVPQGYESGWVTIAAATKR